MSQKKFFAIGLMSGTSLDGLDIAYSVYTLKNNRWSFKFFYGDTIEYDNTWKNKLNSAHKLLGSDLMKLHAEYGAWIGKCCKAFIKKNKTKRLDLICSHGHTVFHQPENKFTFQLGDGNAIYSQLKIPVVFDFRSLDVQLGGQGAPLVPIGDKYLFSDYDVCINLGGIANISFDKNKKRIAYDICFVNMGLNFLMNSIGQDFDKDGLLSSEGSLNLKLLERLNTAYKTYGKMRPSLAREQFEKSVQPILNDESISVQDRLRTFSESIVYQLNRALIDKRKTKKILITGGGAKNKFLISLLKKRLDSKIKIVIPDENLIDFKEAIVFGLLGVLRKLNQKNVLKSVTHSKKNSVSGLIAG